MSASAAKHEVPVCNRWKLTNEQDDSAHMGWKWREDQIKECAEMPVKVCMLDLVNVIFCVPIK